MAKGQLKTSSKPAKAAPAVKDGRVTKPAQTPVAKSKDTAKKVAANTLKGKSDKKARKIKEPSPESESESEDDSDISESEASGSGDDSGSSVSNSDVEDVAAAKPKINGSAKAASAPPKINGASKPAADDDDSEEDSDGDSAGSESSDEESDKELPAAPKPSKNTTAGAEEDDTSDESESSDDDDEAPAKVKAGGVKVNGVVKKAEASDGDEGSSSDSESSISASDDSDEEKEETAPPKKRKADEPVTPAAKKSKTIEPDSAATGNLFVGNLSWNVDEEWLAREFEGFGEITGCRVITDRDSGRSKGYGYVEFANAADAAKALEGKSGDMIDGREIRIDYSTPRTPKDGNTPQQRAQRYGDARSNPSDTLFLGNLSFDCTSDIVSEAFESFGTVTRVSLPTDRETGNLKGFGYVGYSSVEEAQAALDAMNGEEIAGRPVRIDFAGPRPDNGGTGGRGGRGGFGGGRDRGGFGGSRGRGGFGDRGGRGGRGGFRGGRGTGANTTNRGGFGDFKGRKMTF